MTNAFELESAGIQEMPTDQHHPLLLSKLRPTLASRHLVNRTQITDRVFRSINTKVVLIQAPAGFGKTTVMLELLARYRRENTACVWLNLDDADNDAPRFLTYLRLALDTVLDDRSSQSDNGIALTLFSRVAAHSVPFVLFMDEFEVLRSTTVLGLMSRFIEGLPPGVQVVLGSRRSPDIGLARLRAHGHLLEIDAGQLRFSADETNDFLTRQRHLKLDAQQVIRLYRSTEGWPAALWLASVALERRSDAEEFIASFAGSEATIADYLAEDVLSGQTDHIRDFLLKTSILDELNPQVCDAICGTNDGELMLATVERANLFLIPLDEKHTAYRYHGLFLVFLRAQLKRHHPEWLAALHRCASDWYLAKERPIPAITHALASENLAYALPLLEVHADTLLGGGRLRLLTRWLDPLPPQQLQDFPRLRMVQAWAVAFTRGPHEALALIDGLEAENLGNPEAVAQLLALRPLLLGMTDRIEDSYTLALEHLDLVKPGFAFAFGMLSHILANTSMILGRFHDARRYADGARKAQVGISSKFQFALAESVEGAIDLMQGRLKQAMVRLRAAAGATGEDLVRSSSRNAFPGILLAEALYEVGDSDSAERLLSTYVPMVQDLGLPDHLINAHILLSRILRDKGDAEKALQVLEDLESLGHRLALTRVVACARLERARGLIAAEKFSAAEDQLQQCADSALWSEIAGRHYIANDLLTHSIGHARWLIRSGASAEAIPRLKHHVEVADNQKRHRRALKLRILLCEALYRDGQRKPAMRQLRRALEIAGAEGFIRTFLEEGPGLRSLLMEYFQVNEESATDHTSSTLLTYIRQEQRNARTVLEDVPHGPSEPLSRKELMVLELLAEGYSNNSMAEKLFVSETTVRTHLRNINVKLHATSRTQAIVIARRLRFIS